MNKNILAGVIILLFALKVEGQGWYPDGAEWYFNQQILLDYQAHGYTKYTVDNDTVIIDKIAKIISFKSYNFHTGTSGKTSTIYVREENSKVFYWTGSEFKLMYDFTLKPGDTLDVDIINHDCESVSPIKLDSLSFVMNSGVNLAMQYLSFMVNSTPQNYYVTEKVIEKVGRIESFIYTPECGIDVMPWENLQLRCYRDSEISYTSNWWSEFCSDCPCDTLIDGSTGVPFKEVYEQTFLYPNPCNDILNINHSKSVIKNIFLYNSLGQLINSYEPKEIFLQLDLKTLESGIYYVSIQTDNQTETKRIIKL